MECPIPGKRKLVPEYFSSSRSRKIANQGQSKQYYISHGDINDDDDCCDNTMTVLDDKANDIRTCGNEEDEEGKDSVCPDFGALLKHLSAQAKLIMRTTRNVEGSSSEEATNDLEVSNRIKPLYSKFKRQLQNLPSFLSNEDPHNNKNSDGQHFDLLLLPPSHQQHQDVIHFFARAISRTHEAVVTRKRTLRISQEIASLSTDLPIEWASSIFIRADESRPDVLRAMIIGPEETPYANGCYIFDILLPVEYPMKPPSVQLLTTGGGRVRFGPNLYANGKVCLSLLGTWQGPSWNPESSTILQVLISIQSLIFCESPYFNEPGYEFQKQNQKSNKLYNIAVGFQNARVAILQNLKFEYPELNEPMRAHFYAKRYVIHRQLMALEADLSVLAVDAYTEASFHGLCVPSVDQIQQLRDVVMNALYDINFHQETLRVD
eukprot:gene9323-1590_t